MKITELIKPAWIRTRLVAESPAAVIDLLTAALAEAGMVKASYAQAVKEREAVFPTGLPTAGIKVALPHASAEHVHRSAIAVGTLANPVAFHVMGSPEERVAVQIVFLLAIAEPKHQAEALAQLVGIVQQEEVLSGILDAADGEAVCRLIALAAAGQG